jgi:hypothetical protein
MHKLIKTLRSDVWAQYLFSVKTNLTIVFKAGGLRGRADDSHSFCEIISA